MLGNLRLLLVEDSADDAEQIVSAIMQHGYAPAWQRVDTERDYLAGIETLPDVILADYRLPRFSGPRALQLLKERGLDVPFIVVSGAVGDEEAARLITLGASDFLLKDRLARIGPAVEQAVLRKQKLDEERLLAAALREREEQLRLLFESTAEGIYRIDLDGKCTFINRAGLRMLGHDSDQNLLGAQTHEAFHHTRVDGSAYPTGECPIYQACKKGEELHVADDIFWRADGTNFPVEYWSYPVRRDGEVIGGVVTFMDISERKRQEEQIARFVRIQSVMTAINSTIVRVHDRQKLFDETCEIAVEKGGFPLAWIGLLDAASLDVTPAARAGMDSQTLTQVGSSARADIKKGQGVVGRAIRSKQPVFCNDIAAEPGAGGDRRRAALQLGYRSVIALPLIVEDAVAGNLSLFAREANFFNEDEIRLLTELSRDISFALNYLEKARKLDYLAYYDPVTGLANRNLFLDRLAQGLRGAERSGDPVALAMIDVQGFAQINDSLGRHAGDALLNRIGERLRSVALDGDDIACTGGDTFAVMFGSIGDGAELARVLETKVLEPLSQPFRIDDQEVRIAARVGAAMFPGDARQADALFSSAEIALKQAKTSGERVMFFSPETNARATARLGLEARLRRAVEREEFTLHYQPKFDLQTRSITGLEALIRWDDPGGVRVMPSEFIPILEETGMILEVGRWVLDRAVATHMHWSQQGLRPPRIAVNVSPVQLRQKGFVATLIEAVERTGGSQDRCVDIEITEGVIMEDFDATIGKLRAVRELGIGIAVDDFGTGYSSLRYIARLPITALKIDRAFVKEMTTNPDDMTIVSSIISLARSLNIRVIAEGVETEEQAKFLRLLRCDEAQGYLFSKPVPSEQMLLMLREA